MPPECSVGGVVVMIGGEFTSTLTSTVSVLPEASVTRTTKASFPINSALGTYSMVGENPVPDTVAAPLLA